MNRPYQILFFIILSYCVNFNFVEAKHNYGNLYVQKVIRVHDGDTFIVDIDNVHSLIGKGVSVRINGIDAPEITDKREEVHKLAIASRDYVINRLENAHVIELCNLQRDKYFRLLADVYLDGINLADELIKAGLAQPYDGKKKPNWNSENDSIGFYR